MNVLTRAWLRFKKCDGTFEYRPPSAIADPGVVELAMPRADFQGAAYQFLIGLLQTTVAPGDHYDWFDRLESPPTVAELEAAFRPLDPAFELDGDGPRFMQDLDPMEAANALKIAGLLIDAPGINGIKNNTDLFVKRGRVETLCPDCAALALFTLQINAPSGGAGYRVGLRGGGPLTTLVLPDQADASLWTKLWLNVLPALSPGERDQSDTLPAADNAAVFPWMGATRTSEKKGSDVLPGSVHPLHVYWAMPRRYRLIFEYQPCGCDLCGRAAETAVREVRARNYGMNYGGPWLHPLTPYRFDSKKPAVPPLSSKGQPGGVGYRHWSHLVLPDREGETERPAAVVHDYLTGKYQTVQEEKQAGTTAKTPIRQARVWAFGYDMDNMKPRGWYSVEMPLVVVPEAQQARLRGWVVEFVELARQAARATRTQIKSAWFERPKDVKGDMSAIDQQFYEATESAFFGALRQMADALARRETNIPADIASDWYRQLHRMSLQLFDEQALSGPLAELDMKRLIRARQYLLHWWCIDGKRGGSVSRFAQWGGFDAAQQKNEESGAVHG